VKSVLRVALVTALGGWLLTGCQSSGEKGSASIPNTPSGRPEVTVQADQPTPILQAARDFFKPRGYFEGSSTHVYELVFDKPASAEKRSRALRVRLRVTKQSQGAWRLIGVPVKVEDWRSDLESESLVTSGYAQIQGFLEAIKAQVEGSR
jgi:hypothetical protein